MKTTIQSHLYPIRYKSIELTQNANYFGNAMILNVVSFNVFKIDLQI